MIDDNRRRELGARSPAPPSEARRAEPLFISRPAPTLRQEMEAIAQSAAASRVMHPALLTLWLLGIMYAVVGVDTKVKTLQARVAVLEKQLPAEAPTK